jgi:tryptophan synthase alpha chain
MTAIDRVFEQLRAGQKKAFMPFITAGDPDLNFTADAIREFAKRGAALCEVGIPYSDPIADGPVIQESYTRALARKTKLADILAMLKSVTGEISMPVVMMVSYAIVYRHGLQAFVDDASAAGVAGLILPDLPVEESASLAKLCQAKQLSLIQLVTPTTIRSRAQQIAHASTGFIYYVSVAGITGERTELPADLIENVRWLRSQTKVPVCIGFGISRPEHVKLLAPEADGLIVGSAIVRRIGQGADKPREALLREIGDYATELLQAF